MTDEMMVESLPVFGPEDDVLHDEGERWWATETSWWSFNVPERSLGGWIYTLIRPNIGIVQGGAWVWDETADQPWEVPYYRNHSAVSFEAGTDLRDCQLRTGASIKMVEPGQVYQVGYLDEGRLAIDLRFEGVHAPQPFAAGAPPFLAAHHFDQTCRVTGTIELLGETIPVDCLSLRDRSWGPRPETRPRRMSYCFGTASETLGFFATTSPGTPGDPVAHGYLIRDGVTTRVNAGHREERRDTAGFLVGESLTCRDVNGREVVITGEPVSRIAVNRHTAVTWNYLMRWEIDGETAWGEDQDMWPVPMWADHRRAMRS